MTDVKESQEKHLIEQLDPILTDLRVNLEDPNNNSILIPMANLRATIDDYLNIGVPAGYLNEDKYITEGKYDENKIVYGIIDIIREGILKLKNELNQMKIKYSKAVSLDISEEIKLLYIVGA